MVLWKKNFIRSFFAASRGVLASGWEGIHKWILFTGELKPGGLVLCDGLQSYQLLRYHGYEVEIVGEMLQVPEKKMLQQHFVGILKEEPGTTRLNKNISSKKHFMICIMAYKLHKKC